MTRSCRDPEAAAETAAKTTAKTAAGAAGGAARGWMLAVLVLLAAALGACKTAPWSPSPPSRELQLKEPVRLLQLANGMRVLVLPDQSVDTVAIDVRHQVGSTADPPGKEGLAHLAEHLLFETRPWGPSKPTVKAVLAAAALYSNAQTTWDYTHYSILGAKESTTVLAEVAAARLRFDCQDLSQEIFEREREVVRNELRTRHGNESARFSMHLHQAIYGADHAYHHMPGGTESSLDGITLADVCAFVDQYYRPETTIVVAAGAMTEESIEDLLARMGTLPERPGPAPAQIPPAAWAPAAAPVIMEANTRHSTTMLVFPLPPRHHRDDLAARRVLKALAERAERFQPDYITEVGTGRMGGALAPVGVLWANVELPGDLERADDFLRAQIVAFREAGFVPLSTEEITAMRDDSSPRERGSSVFARGSAENATIADQIAEKYYQAHANDHDTVLLFGLDDPIVRPSLYADYVQFDDSNGFLTGELKRNHGIEVATLRAVGERLLGSEPMTVHVRATPSVEETYTGATAVDVIESTDEHLVSRLPADPRLAKRALTLPPYRSRLRDTRIMRLDNGMRVIMLPSSTLPLVHLQLVFRSGHAQDPPGQGGLAHIAAGLASSGGARQRFDSASALALSLVGARTGYSVDQHTTTFAMEGQARYVDVLIHNLENRVRGQYSDDAIAKLRKRMAAWLAEPDIQQAASRSRARRAAVYGADHPYAREAGLTPASLERIDAAAAAAFQQAHYRASNATLIVTGQFDPEVVEEHIRFSFQDWEAGAATEAAAEIGPHARAPGPAHLGIADEDRLQTGIAMFYPTAPGVDDDHAARMVLARMLSLRMQAVREVLAASYGIDVSYSPEVGPGLFTIAGDVSRARAGEALAAMRAAIDGLRRGEDFDRDFVIARRRVARDLLIEASDARSLAGRLAFLAVHDLPQDFHERLARQVARMKPDEVARVLARELDPAQETILCVGTRADIERAYQQAGIERFEIVE